MSGYYSIRKFSQLTGVTTATLRYYDNIAVLRPSFKTSHQHRRYTKADLAKLQQLTTLRYLGFSLEQIKQILADKALDIKQSLQVQKMIMSEKAKRLHEAAKLIENLINSLEQNDLIDWQIQAKIIEALQLQDTQKNGWYKTFLTPSESKAFNTLTHQRSPEFWQDYQARWALLFKDIEANLATDPEGDIGLQFTKRWFALVDEVYSDNRALGNKLWEGYKAGVISDSPLPYNPAVIEYMSRAKKKHRGTTNE